MTTQKNIFLDKEKASRWRLQLAQWQSSGLSITKFCEQHQLSTCQFYYWKKCLLAKESNPQSLSWMPVKLAVTPETSSAPIVVRLPRSISLELCSSVAVETWRNLFTALEVTSC